MESSYPKGQIPYLEFDKGSDSGGRCPRTSICYEGRILAFVV